MIIISILRGKHERQNWDSAVVARVWLDFGHNTDLTLCQVYKWTNLTIQLGYFVFWNLSMQVSWVPGILQFRKPKSCRIFQMPLFEKRMDYPPWKCLFFGHGFSRKRDNNPYVKIYMVKLLLLIYRMMPRMSNSGGWTIDFEATGIIRCFGS
jgi:hypothetical protein